MDKENLLEQIGVYTITSPSGKKYVGMTAAQSFKERWKQHRKLLRGNRHICTGLQNAFNKYGFEGLSFEVVKSYKKPAEQDTVLTQLIQAEEIRFWEMFKSEGVKLYNGRPTGTGSVHHTDETRAKISAGMRKHFLESGVYPPHSGPYKKRSPKDEATSISRSCLYCSMDFKAFSTLKLYCSQRCSQMFRKTNAGLKYTIYPEKKVLEEKYSQTQDIEELSQFFGMSKNDVRFFLVQYGFCGDGRKFRKYAHVPISSLDIMRECLLCHQQFKVKNKSQAQYCSDECRKEVSKPKLDYTQKPTKELLEHLYIDEGFSTTQIAEKLNCTQPNVYYLLKKFDIPTRDKNRHNRKV